MNPLDDHVVDDQIRAIVSDGPPLSVERRLRSQLADLRSRLSKSESPSAPVAVSRARPAAWWRLGAACAAAVVLVAAISLFLRPQISFAEVQEAVLRQTWIHVRSTFADRGKGEDWFSPARNVSASRQGGALRYADHRLQIYYSYEPEEKVVYRAPIVANTPPGSEFESIAEAIKILLQGDGLPEKPLEHLSFLGSQRDKMTVLDQRVDEVTEQEQTWLDYRITVKHAELAEPVRALFRVDTRTKLPKSCRVEAQPDGKPATLVIDFDYPEKGPADIYELGAPKTAKFVDRVPAGDVKLIVETLEAGRERMDDYRAVFVSELELPDSSWWMAFPEAFYRKGDRYRRDFSVRDRNDKWPERPAADADRRQWWFERAKQFRFYPVYVQLGPTSYTCTTEQVVDADGSQHLQITAIEKYDNNLKPGALLPVDWVMRPEFACRPPMGIGDPHQAPSLDPNPAEGPAGCVLLSVAHTSKEGRINEQGMGAASVNRFWLDPQRDYIAMQWETATRDENGKETIVSQHLVEETARSPQGVWYATRIRLKNAARQADGKQLDQIYHIFVDFDAELPDAQFEVPTPQRIE
jgi:hypothetical protein